MIRKTGTLALAVLCLLAIVGTSSAESPPSSSWSALRYFYYDWTTSEAYVGTSAGWGGKTVKATVSFPFGTAPAWASQRKQLTPAYLWTATCKKDKQVAVFTHAFQAPGPATSGSVSVDYAGGFGSLASVVVLLNGRDVIHTTSSGRAGVALTSAALQAFRSGSNTVTVRATKHEGACGTPSAKAVGVAVGLAAKFVTDVAAVPSPAGPKVFYKSSSRRAITTFGSLQIKNPSAVTSVSGALHITMVAGRFMKVLVGGPGSLLPPPAAAPPFGKCTVETKVQFLSYSIVCPYTDLKPGATATVQSFAGAALDDNLPSNFSGTTFPITWEVTAAGEVANGDDTQSFTVVFCGAGQSDPGCATAK
jgi:hypothetical protein